MFSPKTAQIDFFRKDPVFEYSGGRRSAKTGSKGLTGCGERVFRFSPKISKNLVRRLHKYEFFSNIFKCKGIFCHVQLILWFLTPPGMCLLAL